MAGTVNVYRALGSISYATVAASQTTQTLISPGGTGGVGDYLARLVIVPATTAPGVVQIKDGANTAITVYTGGTVGGDLTPIRIDLGICSTNGAWQVTTGANLSVVACGQFS